MSRRMDRIQRVTSPSRRRPRYTKRPAASTSASDRAPYDWRPSVDDAMSFNMDRWLMDVSFMGDGTELVDPKVPAGEGDSTLATLVRWRMQSGQLNRRPHLPKQCGWRLYASSALAHTFMSALAEDDVNDIAFGSFRGLSLGKPNLPDPEGDVFYLRPCVASLI